MRAINLIARRELGDTLHNRWLIGFGALFAVLTIAISYFGLASAREVGFQGFSQVAASLLNLILFTVPMVAMTVPITGLTGDGEELAVMLTQPLARHEVLVGRYIGMLGSVAGTLLGGLAIGGLVVLARAGGAYVGNFAILIALTFALIALFLALGMLIGVGLRDRTRALGLGLAVWFALDVLYDLLVFGVTVSNPGVSLKLMLLGALALNPIDAVRVFYLLATGSSSFVGVTGAVLSETLGSTLGLGALAASFVLMPLATLGAAGLVFQRRDF
jgi:Cu-processing system permease protein